MQTKSIIISGIPCAYIESSGEETPLIFLHGWGQNKHTFEKLYSLLEDRKIPFYGIDFPGFGSTPLPKEVWGVGDYARFVHEFIDKKKIEKFTLIGHSFGGRVSIVLGSLNIKGLKQLILIGSAGILPRVSFPRRFTIKIANIFLKLPGGGRLRIILRDIFGSRDDRNAGPLRDIFRKVISEDLEGLLPSIEAHTLLLWGALDTETPLQDGLKMKEQIPHSLLKIFEHGTHFVYQEFPEEIMGEIVTFIK